MSRTLLLGLDSGSTATKAVLFDRDGNQVGGAGRRLGQDCPRPHHIERDMEAAWKASAGAIREAMGNAGADASEIAAVGVTGHGDGLYLTDRNGRALGPAILSLDSRAFTILRHWEQRGILDQALALTGQKPYPYAAATLLAWIRRETPERFARIGHVLSCKDWLRFKLTGAAATDPTDASASFTEVRSQRYASDVLALFDLSEVEPALPPIIESTRTAGYVSRDAATATGLARGTPVATGLHDVTASAVGLGNLEAGALSITAGTFSINETLSDAPTFDARWACRNGLRAGQWMNMSISPASSSNIDWYLREAYGAELGRAAATGRPVFELIEEDIRRAFDDHSGVIFHPFLYGSPYNNPASAAFFGLHGWHERRHMLRAVIEGVVFNHRGHVEALAERFPLCSAGLTGGGTSRPLLAQLFADALGMPMNIPQAAEVGALGAALCGGVAASVYPSLREAAGRACRVARRYEPHPDRHSDLTRRYRTYTELVNAVASAWPNLDVGESKPRDEAADG